MKRLRLETTRLSFWVTQHQLYQHPAILNSYYYCHEWSSIWQNFMNLTTIIDPIAAWPYGPLTALTYLISNAHSSLSTAFCRYLLTFSRRSFSTSSIHHHPGLPLLLLLFGSLSNIFLTLLTWSILTTCPTDSNLFFLISAVMSRSLCSSLNSWSIPILHIPCSITDHTFSSPMHPAFSYPSQSHSMFHSKTLQLVSLSFCTS